MKTTKSLTIIFFLICLILLAAFIVSEIYYYTPLFNISIDVLVNLTNNSSPELKKFFLVVTYFGQEEVYLPYMYLVILWTQLNKSYFFVSIISHTVYINNLMKMGYRAPRPFWLDNRIKNVECETGFGNPSGHAMVAPVVYMTFWVFLCELRIFKHILWKIFFLFIFIAIIGLISFSRIILGVHTIDQVLYGSLLGFLIFFYYSTVLRYAKKSQYNRFAVKFNNGFYVIFTYLKFLAFMLAAILTYFLLNFNVDYLKDVRIYCLNPEYKWFQNDALNGCFVYLIVIGAYSGILFNSFILRIRMENLRYWNHGSCLVQLIKFLLFKVSLAPLLLTALIPEYWELYIVFPFKFVLPFLLTSFLLFGPFMSLFKKIKQDLIKKDKATASTPNIENIVMDP